MPPKSLPIVIHKSENPHRFYQLQTLPVLIINLITKEEEMEAACQFVIAADLMSDIQ